MSKMTLAWRIYPEPDGTDYFEDDLAQKTTVIELFDYCQILEAAIFADGWKFLFEKYGLQGIIEIDRESGWFNEEDLGEEVSRIYYHSLISGYNPQKSETGEYSEENGDFKMLDNSVCKVDWKEIYNLKNSF